jgi:hypothetical protein
MKARTKELRAKAVLACIRASQWREAHCAKVEQQARCAPKALAMLNTLKQKVLANES